MLSMNYSKLTRDESAFLIFSFKRTLRDKEGLTPTMVQFYEQSIAILREKVSRIDSARKDGRSLLDDARARKASVPSPWPND